VTARCSLDLSAARPGLDFWGELSCFEAIDAADLRGTSSLALESATVAALGIKGPNGEDVPSGLHVVERGACLMTKTSSVWVLGTAFDRGSAGGTLELSIEIAPAAATTGAILHAGANEVFFSDPAQPGVPVLRAAGAEIDVLGADLLASPKRIHIELAATRELRR
jgi:hypothetical protein